MKKINMRRTSFGASAAALGRLGVVATLLAASSAACAQTAQVPPLVQPPSQEYHTGKIVFEELVTPDLGAAKRFYGSLFGWTFTQTSFGQTQYAQAFNDGQPVAGLVETPIPAGAQRQPAWLTFISARDVDQTASKVTSAGGKVLLAPRNLAGRGKEAVFADPQGAVFGVVASSSGDPQDVMAAPGEWVWSSLITSDPDKDAAFYQDLFGYAVFDLPNEAGAHFIFASDNYSRASANPLPEHLLKAHPHWLNYVRVDDAVAMAARVQALGGKVLVEPRTDRHGGKVAVVADTTGAPFGLLEYGPNENQGEKQ